MRRKKRIGLALAGGGASGLVHIGVLKVLEEENIGIDAISGVSLGALIGGLYSAGYKAADIEKLIKKTDWQRLLDFTLPINSFIRGRRIENKIRRVLGNKQFSDLNERFFVVAANLDLGNEVIIDDGDLTTAIRASIAIPGVIAAKKIGKYRYADGALVDPTGILPLKKKCDILIAVDTSAPFEKNIKLIKSRKDNGSELMNIIRNNIIWKSGELVKKTIRDKKFKMVPSVLMRSLEKILDRLLTPSRIINFVSGGVSSGMVDVVLRSYQISMNRLYALNLEIGKPDVVIKPEHSYLGWVEFDKVDEFIKAGEEATRKEIGRIKKLLG